MVRRGSVGSASDCCKGGPSSILGSVPQEGLSHWAYKQWRDGERPRPMATDKCIVRMWLNECMYVIKYENKQKEWHPAIKPLTNLFLKKWIMQHMQFGVLWGLNINTTALSLLHTNVINSAEVFKTPTWHKLWKLTMSNKQYNKLSLYTLTRVAAADSM